MNLTFWYIILLATNLTSKYSTDFTLTMQKDKEKFQIHVYEINNMIWVAEFFDPSTKKNIPVNFKMKEGGNVITSLFFEEEPIDLKKIFESDLDKTDWKNKTEIKFNEELTKKGESSILIKWEKDKHQLSLTQQAGFLSEYQIVVNWIPKVKTP